MSERKCDYPSVVKLSGGRAGCPDTLYKGFRVPGNCLDCPKNSFQLSERRRQSKIIALNEITNNGGL